MEDKKDLVKKYPDCCDGIGRKRPGQYHVMVDPSIPPAVHAHQHLPLSLRNHIEKKNKQQLDDMVPRRIISKMQEGEPTAWVNSLVYRKKA